jgi:hypothetical protein
MYASRNITVVKSKKVRLAGHVARMVNMRNAYNILIGKLERKRTFGRCYNGSKVSMVGKCVWIDLAQDRDQWRALVNTAMNCYVS